MFNKLLVLSVLILACVRPANAESNQVVVASGRKQEVVVTTQKYQQADDFLYEEKIVDLIVDQKTGQLTEKTEANTEDNSDQEHPLDE